MASEQTRDYDEVTSFLTEFGPFQIAVFVLLSASAIPQGYMMVSMVFLADIPEHHCKLSLNSSDNGDPKPWDEASFRQDSTRVGPDMCSRYKRINNSTEASGFGNETEGCLDGWEYSTEQYISTIVSEWDLVCDEAWKVPLSTSIFFFGCMIGSFISGHLSDRFGRKPVFFSTLALQTIFTLIQASSDSWAMYCVLNFLRGTAQASNYLSSVVLGSELLAESARVNFMLLGHSVFYGVGYAYLPLFAYFIRDWRTLLVAFAIPGFLFIPVWWLIPESPRWLLIQGRREEAELIIRKTVRIYRVPAPEVIFQSDDCLELTKKDSSEQQNVYTFLDLIRTPNMRNISIINMFLWAVTSMTFYGLSLNTAFMSGDAYINCLFSAVTEIVAYMVNWMLTYRAPRPTILFSSLLFCGSTLLIIELIPEDQQMLIQVMAMLGKLGVTGAFAFLFLWTTELFPTVVRNMGLGLSSTSARIGSILTPYIIYIGIYNKMLPYIIFGTTSLLTAFLCLLLPDTKGCKLPDTISQAQPVRWMWGSKKTNQTLKDILRMENRPEQGTLRLPKIP